MGTHENGDSWLPPMVQIASGWALAIGRRGVAIARHAESLDANRLRSLILYTAGAATPTRTWRLRQPSERDVTPRYEASFAIGVAFG
jgi:hypothetical protein